MNSGFGEKSQKESTPDPELHLGTIQPAKAERSRTCRWYSIRHSNRLEFVRCRGRGYLTERKRTDGTLSTGRYPLTMLSA